MLSEIRHVIAEEMRAAESRIWNRIEPLLSQKEEDTFGGGTFEDTANLFIPDLEQSIMSCTHKSDCENGQSIK
ncbi:MAG: hypothetical protein Q8912_04810 [Bacillota bacterium]|nr:hypothetical protein [Bacillota bacterium]MDP4159224.1 hypothetical protein [Bacillota bacterium]